MKQKENISRFDSVGSFSVCGSDGGSGSAADGIRDYSGPGNPAEIFAADRTRDPPLTYLSPDKAGCMGAGYAGCYL